MIEKYGTVIIQTDSGTGDITHIAYNNFTFRATPEENKYGIGAYDMVVEWLKGELDEYNYDI